MRAISQPAPLITFASRDAIVLPLTLPFFAFAVMSLLPAPDLKPGRRRTRQKAKPHYDWTGFLLAIVLIGCVLTVFASSIAELTVTSLLSNRGYTRCPAPFALAHPPPEQWVRPGGRCP